MVNTHHGKAIKASSCKGAESPTNNADNERNENESSSDSEDPNFGAFMKEEMKVLESKIRKQLGKAIKNFDGRLDSIACTKWLSNIKGTTLDDLLCRARVREADLLRKKNKEAKKTKRKLDFIDWDGKKPKQDQSRRSGGTQIKTPCKKCHKTHLGVCRPNLLGCYKCGALNHTSKDCKKPMILCYNCNQLRHNSNECPNLKVIEAKPLKSIKKEKVEKTGIPTLTARAYMMATEEDNVVRGVITCIILVNSLPTRVLYDSSASVFFVSFEFSKNLPTPPNKLPFPLDVKIAGNEIVVVTKVYWDVEIKIDDSVFKIDLIPIVLGLFNIVMGMDWLDEYNANILCS
nr:hypothetical protein [Tanacetum cinerariifolium]